MIEILICYRRTTTHLRNIIGIFLFVLPSDMQVNQCYDL